MPTITKKPTAKELNLYWKTLILDCIDFDGYDLPETKTLKERLAIVSMIIKAETGCENFHEEVISDWLSGLPSLITLPFYNSEILAMMKEIGTINEKTTEKRKDSLLVCYWDFMACKLIQMISGTSIPKELKY
jgi:hypothetical protein